MLQLRFYSSLETKLGLVSQASFTYATDYKSNQPIMHMKPRTGIFLRKISENF